MEGGMVFSFKISIREHHVTLRVKVLKKFYISPNCGPGFDLKWNDKKKRMFDAIINLVKHCTICCHCYLSPMEGYSIEIK